MRSGEAAYEMYFIAAGEVEIQLPKPVKLGEGHFFGERALIHKSLRSATVRALQPL